MSETAEKSKMVGVSIPSDVYAVIQKAAAEKDWSVAKFIRNAAKKAAAEY